MNQKFLFRKTWFCTNIWFQAFSKSSRRDTISSNSTMLRSRMSNNLNLISPFLRNCCILIKNSFSTNFKTCQSKYQQTMALKFRNYSKAVSQNMIRVWLIFLIHLMKCQMFQNCKILNFQTINNWKRARSKMNQRRSLIKHFFSPKKWFRWLIHRLRRTK